MSSRAVAAVFVAMLGGAAALATGADAVCGIICVDSVNECGERYGGCYDPCLEDAPEAPACTIPYLHAWFDTEPPTPFTPLPEDGDEDCEDIIVCVDGVNACGIPFGDCVPACLPWNITIPECPPDLTDSGNTTQTLPGEAAEEPKEPEASEEPEKPEEPKETGEPKEPKKPKGHKKPEPEEPEEPEWDEEPVPFIPSPDDPWFH
ncbi:hypothetical protein BBK36DRAFT_1162809 [Trichoderma citrinoviride]|uniref:Uncharacterized protein n=1 Tax=Trichoderma citrinoviride TaxID=58853 RepID=A0A2T4AZQ9_9HYPO|nr:hypothetical protein BBK36DRAFT_1162809 [Trichoderma citrinoviride]PTB62550.1 hypothetical protein BBK36DRAFT_1162809 [Trichoderma citrinoviride]